MVGVARFRRPRPDVERDDQPMFAPAPLVEPELRFAADPVRAVGLGDDETRRVLGALAPSSGWEPWIELYAAIATDHWRTEEPWGTSGHYMKHRHPRVVRRWD